MERGYVKLWRKTLDSGLLQNATAWQVFGYLLLNATHKRTRLLKDTIPVTLEPGQVLSGRKKIAQECKLSEQNVRTALALLEKLEIVTIQPTNKYSIISFVNWETYQQEQPANQPTSQPAPNQQVTSSQPAPNHIQEHKNIRTKEEEYKITARSDKKSLQAADDSPVVISLPLISGEQWEVHQHQIDRWIERYPGVNILQQLRNMIGWCESNPTRRKTARGIARFVEAWLAREQDRSAKPMQVNSSPRLSWQEEKERRDLEAFLNDTPRPWEVQHG